MAYVFPMQRFSMQSSEAALQVANLSYSYGERKALDNVSLTVGRGQYCALLGQNGAGKSTLFALITRLFSAVDGSIKVLGFDVHNQPSEALRRIGVVFQSRTLDPELTVMENLSYHAALHGLSGRAGRVLAGEALARVSMDDRLRDRVRQLSGGQMRRVEIARALVHRPKLLLLDEPTVGLDIGSRVEISAQVRRLVTEDGLGVLWATHLMEEVTPEDNAVILHKGRIITQGLGSDIIRQSGAADITGAFSQLTGGVHEAEAVEVAP